MLAIKKGDDEIKRRRQKKGLFADVLWILKTEQCLSRTLDWKDVDGSKLRVVHEMALG
jgi:hypothetical protein